MGQITKGKVAQSCPALCNPMSVAPRLQCQCDSPDENNRVGSCSLLQGIFPTQGLNPSLLHCRHIPYHLSHEGSPQITKFLINSSPSSVLFVWLLSVSVWQCLLLSQCLLKDLAKLLIIWVLGFSLHLTLAPPDTGTEDLGPPQTAAVASSLLAWQLVYFWSYVLVHTTRGDGIFILKVFFFFFLVVPCGLWDLSPLTRDWTQATEVKAWNPNHQATRELSVGLSGKLILLKYSWFTMLYISGFFHVCMHISQPRWIPPKRPMGS